MKRNVNLFLQDILESIYNIESFSKDLTKEKLKRNKLRQSAIIRQLEIIGEAAKNVPSSFRKKYSLVPWKDIAGFRDILIHSYFIINSEKVWNVIKKDLPVLKDNIKKILEDKK